MERAEILAEISGINKANYAIKRSSIVYQHMRDPALLRYYYRIKMQPLTARMDLQGSSPTDIFIGRANYPKVYIGPMLPPEFGDTSLLATPERWTDISMDQIVEFRSKLVRGMYLSNVKDVEKGRVQEQVRDLALSESPADSEMLFQKKPFVKMALQDEVQPFGPSAIMKNFELYNFKADTRIENLYFDTDAKATTAIKELYKKGVEVSKIQKSLSAGLFGIQRNRRFVPTRWSITAVDDTLSKDNLKEVKSFDSIDHIQVYYYVSLDNRWLIAFIPGSWQYESAEAWYPNTVWNVDGANISIFSSYEGYNGRKEYAEIGGCYYAARLAVTEKLKKVKRQAMVLILREVHEGYLMPVGVWNVREHVREALRGTPESLYSVDDLFNFIKKKLDIPLKEWIKNSTMLRELLMQRRIRDYV
jgi:hypothetical protein